MLGCLKKEDALVFKRRLKIAFDFLHKSGASVVNSFPVCWLSKRLYLRIPQDRCETLYLSMLRN